MFNKLVQSSEFRVQRKKTNNYELITNNQSGQTLIELMVVILVSVIIIGALVFTTIASLRNAQFSKNQAQATKLAQAGIETVRSLRDRNGLISYQGNQIQFSDLWTTDFTCTGGAPNCQFFFSDTGLLVSGNFFESISPNFKRQVLIEGSGGTESKNFTVTVGWTDFSGSHASRLTTILGKI